MLSWQGLNFLCPDTRLEVEHRPISKMAGSLKADFDRSVSYVPGLLEFIRVRLQSLRPAKIAPSDA